MFCSSLAGGGLVPLKGTGYGCAGREWAGAKTYRSFSIGVCAIVFSSLNNFLRRIVQIPPPVHHTGGSGRILHYEPAISLAQRTTNNPSADNPDSRKRCSGAAITVALGLIKKLVDRNAAARIIFVARGKPDHGPGNWLKPKETQKHFWKEVGLRCAHTIDVIAVSSSRKLEEGMGLGLLSAVASLTGGVCVKTDSAHSHVLVGTLRGLVSRSFACCAKTAVLTSPELRLIAAIGARKLTDLQKSFGEGRDADSREDTQAGNPFRAENLRERRRRQQVEQMAQREVALGHGAFGEEIPMVELDGPGTSKSAEQSVVAAGGSSEHHFHLGALYPESAVTFFLRPHYEYLALSEEQSLKRLHQSAGSPSRVSATVQLQTIYRDGFTGSLRLRVTTCFFTFSRQFADLGRGFDQEAGAAVLAKLALVSPSGGGGAGLFM